MSGPRVGVVMGSRSDEPIAAAAVRVLDRLGVPSETVVASAHRDPEEVRRYARSAERRGLEVIVAVAGLAAALPGVLASHTLLPVIGVPAPAGPLRGMDALLSMTQMPPGVPVGAVGIGEAGGTNGALLAARMLARRDAALKRRLRRYMDGLRTKNGKGSKG